MRALSPFVVALSICCVLASLKLPWLERALAQVYGNSSDSFETIDRALKEMTWGAIAFNAPSSMRINETRTIQLLLGVATIEELKQQLEYQEDADGYETRVGKDMEARLTGNNFIIIAPPNERQPTSSVEPTDWRWQVTPTKKGRQNLQLTLTAYFSVDGEPRPRTIKTFEKIINVEVTLGQQIASLIGKEWKWIGTAILAPVATLAWLNRQSILGRFRSWLLFAKPIRTIAIWLGNLTRLFNRRAK